MPLIQTTRTLIDHVTLGDAPFYVTLLNTPGWLEFIGDRNIHSTRDAEKYLEEGLFVSRRVHGFSYYLVKTLENEPFAIGGFVKKDYLPFPDFGFAQLPSFFGQGYATEFGAAILEYGATHHGLTEVDAVVLPSNDRSIGLLKRLGFVRVESVFDGEEDLDRYHWTHH